MKKKTNKISLSSSLSVWLINFDMIGTVRYVIRYVHILQISWENKKETS